MATVSSLRTIRTRRDAVRVFLANDSPRLLSATVITGAALRLCRRRFGVRDVAAVAMVASTQGVHEWIIHRYLLHAPRREVRGIVIDPGQGHREHHEDPDVLENALLRRSDAARFVVMIGAYLVVLWWPLRRWARPRHLLSAVVAAHGGLLTYEWTHFVDHTSVPLRSAYARHLRAHHRLHHYRDERRWLGITSATGDRLFGTRHAA